MPWLAALIPAVVGGVQAVSGAVQKKKTKDEAKRLSESRPKIGRDQNSDQNLSLVKSDLSNGISAEAEQAYNDITDRDFSTSLSSILKGGGDVNSIGDIYSSNEDGRQKLSILKDNMRLNQIKNLLYQSERNDERNTVTPFQVNQDAPWKDAASANSTERMAADERMWKGINEAGSSLMQFGQGLSESNEINNGEFRDGFGKNGQWRRAAKYGRNNGMDFNEYSSKTNDYFKLLGGAMR